MALTYEAYRDLVQGLREHPEWRAELRPLLLGEEILSIPERLTSLEATVEDRFQRMEALLERLATQTAANTDAIVRLEVQTTADAYAIAALTTAVDKLTERMNFVQGRVSHLDGHYLEERYRGHLVDFYSRHVRRPRRVMAAEIPAVISATESGAITAADRDRLLDTDILVAAHLAGSDDEVIPTSEISYTVNVEDVERAESSAVLLRGIGCDARGFVGGHSITEAAQRLADRLDVFVDLGRISS